MDKFDNHRKLDLDKEEKCTTHLLAVDDDDSIDDIPAEIQAEEKEAPKVETWALADSNPLTFTSRCYSK